MTEKTESRGSNGGRAVKEKYGADFFKQIGRKGGNSLKDNGADYAALGKVGGEATKERHGSAHYSEIGRIGGSRGKGGRKPRNHQ